MGGLDTNIYSASLACLWDVALCTDFNMAWLQKCKYASLQQRHQQLWYIRWIFIYILVSYYLISCYTLNIQGEDNTHTVTRNSANDEERNAAHKFYKKDMTCSYLNETKIWNKQACFFLFFYIIEVVSQFPQFKQNSINWIKLSSSAFRMYGHLYFCIIVHLIRKLQDSLFTVFDYFM